MTPNPGLSPAWEMSLNEKDDKPSGASIHDEPMQKTSSISSFPRSPSSVSRSILPTVYAPGKVASESNVQNPKNSVFLTSRRPNRKPLLVRSEVSVLRLEHLSTEWHLTRPIKTLNSRYNQEPFHRNCPLFSLLPNSTCLVE